MNKKTEQALQGIQTLQDTNAALVTRCAYAERDVREQHDAIKILQAAGLITEDQYSSACTLVAESRELRPSTKARGELILAGVRSQLKVPS